MSDFSETTTVKTHLKLSYPPPDKTRQNRYLLLHGKVWKNNFYYKR